MTAQLVHLKRKSSSRFVRFDLHRSSKDAQLTANRFECVDLLVDDDETDGNGREEIDQEWEKRVDDEKEKMACCPKRLIIRRNLQDTHRSLGVYLSGERFVEEQFIEIGDENSDGNEENQSTSNVRLFEPLTA
jgi:hypothetical protein